MTGEGGRALSNSGLPPTPYSGAEAGKRKTMANPYFFLFLSAIERAEEGSLQLQHTGLHLNSPHLNSPHWATLHKAK